MKRIPYDRLFLPAALGALLLLSLAYGITFAVHDYRSSVSRVTATLADSAQDISRHTQHYLQGYTNLFAALALSPCLSAREPGACNPLLARLNQRFPTVVNFAALDAQGRFFASGQPFDALKPPRGEQFPFFQALRSGASHYVMDPHQGPVSGQRVTGVVVPLTDDAGRFSGVLGGSMTLTELQHLWQRAFDDSRQADQHLLVVDRHQRIIAASPSLAAWVDKPSSALGNLDALLGGREALLRLDGRSYQYQEAPVPISQWRILALAPQQLTLGAYLHHRPWMGMLGLSLSLLTLLILLLLHRERRWFMRLLGKERELARRNRQVERANRELEAFSYAVSHDLRAPLRRIDGFSRALEEEAVLDTRGRHYLTRIQAGVARMEQLIEGLLRLSLTERQPLRCAPLNLSALFQQASRRLGTEGPRHARIEVQAGLAAWGDPALITLVIDNLLDNALKYSAGRSTPQVHIGRTRGPEPPAFYIADNGVGFAMNQAQRLFSPFERLHGDSRFAGIGVGLNTVRRIIERHGGRIWAEAAPEKGATFYFTLPEKPDHPNERDC